MPQRGLSHWRSGGDAPSRDRLDQLFESAFGDFLRQGTEGVGNRGWHPSVDIAETENGYTFYAELPGLAKEDVDVTLENNVLTIRGERKFEKDVKEENYHRVERSYGTFSRSFSLPSNVRSEACNASFRDGVLRIEIPKAEEARPRRIEIGGY
jgi:HSP20 family protein